jgi:hypothetical protein
LERNARGRMRAWSTIGWVGFVPSFVARFATRILFGP